ncbi:MAG: hypothetical protein H0X29_06880 [Parachlamydiaceae bacterium]|nr:hypothetical protein [Parachlamydiaceae bacterium]
MTDISHLSNQSSSLELSTLKPAKPLKSEANVIMAKGFKHGSETLVTDKTTDAACQPLLVNAPESNGVPPDLRGSSFSEHPPENAALVKEAVSDRNLPKDPLTATPGAKPIKPARSPSSDAILQHNRTEDHLHLKNVFPPPKSSTPPLRERATPSLPTTARPAIQKQPDNSKKASSPLLQPLDSSSSNSTIKSPNENNVELTNLSKRSTNVPQEKPQIIATKTFSEKIGSVSNKISSFFSSNSKYVTKGKSVSVFSALHIASYTRATEEKIDNKTWGKKIKFIAKGALRMGSRLLVPITVANEIGSKLLSNIKQAGTGFVKAGKLVHVKLLTNLAKIDNTSKFSVIKKIGAIAKAGIELVGRSILLSSAAIATSISAVVISVVNGVVLFVAGPVSLLGNNRLISQNITQKIMQKTHNVFISSQKLVNQNLDDKIQRAENAKSKMENDKLIAENMIALENIKNSPQRVLLETLKNNLDLYPKNQINEKRELLNNALNSEQAYFKLAITAIDLAQRDLFLQYKDNPSKTVEWSNKKNTLIMESKKLEGTQNYYENKINTLKKEYADSGLS